MPSALRVLLVDDNPDDRALVLRELTREFPGVQAEQVLQASDLGEALDRGEFDLVITDYRLRWTTGIAVLTAVRTRYPHCPVIMFTGTGNEEIAVEAMKIGLDDYIVKKPSHFVRVRAAVRSALERSRTSRQVAALQSRLESLLERLDIGVFRSDVDGNLLEANRLFLTLLGLRSLEAAQSQVLAEWFNHSREYTTLMDRLLRTSQPQEAEMLALTRDGRQIWLRMNVALTAMPDSEAVVDGLLEDVTERRQIKEHTREHAAVKARLSLLSPREYEVMDRVVAGKTNKVIANDLNISSKTVEMHRANLMKKLHVNSLADLVRLVLHAKPPRNDPEQPL